MTSPSGPSTVTTDPNVHTTPSGGSAAFDPTQVLKEFEQIGPAIIRMVLAQVLKAVAGISIFGVEPFAGLATWASDLQDQTNTSTSLIGSIASLFGLGSSSDLAGSPSSIWSSAYATFISPLITGVSDLVDIVQGFFGVTAGSDPLADLEKLGSNLMSTLGDPDLTPATSDFDPIAAGEQMLQNVLTPGGALSTSTQLPAHLLAELGIGQASTNLLPAGGFDDPSVVSGTSGWTYDATTGHTTNGSVWAAGAGILRQMIGVAIGTKPDAITQMSCWTKWTGVTATTGAAICLCANAYSDDEATMLISDPTNRVLAKISTPGTSSSGFAAVSADGASAADSNGWVQLSGQYQAPAGTAKVRLTLEVESVVNAGSVGFDDCVQTIQTGIVDSSLLNNFENLNGQWPGLTVEGFGGINDILTTFQHYTDGLGSAFTQGGGLTDVDLPTLFSLAQTQTNNSITAAFQSAINTIVLQQRTNKSVGHGMNPTSVASFPVTDFSVGGSVVTSTLAAGSAIGQVIRPPENATQGFLQFMASGTSVTNIFVNLYSVDPTTNAKTALWNSGNIASLITSSLAHVRALIPSSAQPTVMPGDQLVAEIVNNGSAALTLATKATGVPNDANEVITNFGFTRSVSAGGASPTSLTSSQGSYGATIPQITIGILDVPANYQPPESTPYLSSGSYTWTPPAWQAVGDIVDLAGCGAAGGGGGSFNFVSGQGGRAGAWNGAKLIVGTDIKIGTNVGVVVGTEGSGGSAFGGSGTAGTSTVFTYTDPSNTTHTLTCAGGAGGANGGSSTPGLSPGNYTQDGIPYFGGAAVGANTHGNAPGGGGGGGISYTGGDTGSDGNAWVRAAQP